MKQHILRINASLNPSLSNSRRLGDHLLSRLKLSPYNLSQTERDLPPDFAAITADWVAASYTAPDQRTSEQRQTLAFSDELVEELHQADQIVITTPMYNFGIPSVLKSWIDLIARVGETFKYTDQGPIGLLSDKPVTILISSGGTPVGGQMDFVSGYLRQVFTFIGLNQVTVIAADRLNVDTEASLSRAEKDIEEHARLLLEAA
jgi:FMN-dependent NADH-azoreductase